MNRTSIDKNIKNNKKIVDRNKNLKQKWENTGLPQSNLLTPSIDNDNWGKFKDVIIGSPFQSPFGCSNTLTSQCVQMDNIDECKKICKDNELCDYGNFITMNGKSYCLNFVNYYPDYNILGAMWNKNNNYQSKNIDVTSFVDLNKYPVFGSTEAQSSLLGIPKPKIYYGDYIKIRLWDDDLFISDIENNLGFTNDGNLLKLISKPLVPLNTLAIRNLDTIIINIADTYLVVQQELDDAKFTNNLEWVYGLGQFTNKGQQFILVCEDRKNNEVLEYGDKIRIMYENKIMCTDGKKIFLKEYDDVVKNKSLKYNFKIDPHFPVSYCTNDEKTNPTNTSEASFYSRVKENNKTSEIQSNVLYKCNITSIADCEIDKNGDYNYKGKPIYGNLWCSGQCKDDVNASGPEYMIKTHKNKKTLILDQIVISISSLVITILILFIFSI